MLDIAWLLVAATIALVIEPWLHLGARASEALGLRSPARNMKRRPFRIPRNQSLRLVPSQACWQPSQIVGDTSQVGVWAQVGSLLSVLGWPQQQGIWVQTLAMGVTPLRGILFLENSLLAPPQVTHCSCFFFFAWHCQTLVASP